MRGILNEFTSLLAEGKQVLRASRRETPDLDAELLLAGLLGMERAKLLLDPPDMLAAGTADLYRRLLTRRAAGEPIHYITGKKEFYNHTFKVNPSVLIPRPETEEMVDLVLKRYGDAPLAVCDVGTGSGCIGISLALARPSWRVVAADISDVALSTARQNAERLGASNVVFAESDLMSGTEGQFDVIVSNPPYIDADVRGAMQVEVRKFEPPLALFAEEKGLKVVRALVAEAAGRLNPGGAFFCEIGYDQKDAVEKLFENPRWEEVTFHKDLAGHHRIVSAKLRSRGGEGANG